jgi:hypothetical protein
MLQAYVDGELSSEMMERVATHIAACPVCTEAAHEIENESQLLAEAFAPELALSVPTGRLHLRLDAAIAELEAQKQSRSGFEHQASRLRSWLAGLASPFSFMPQHAVGFASLIALVAFGAIFAFIILRPQPSALNVAQGAKTIGLPSFEPGQENKATNEDRSTQGEGNDTVARVQADGARIIKAGSRRTTGKVTPSVVKQGVEPPAAATPETASVQLLPGEKNYLKAIASLDTAIKAGGDNAMRPTLRVEYERNLRVVDEAIAQTRAVAQRNPNDKDAAEFLLSAYQSKVELMNTVAEQAQLSQIYR